MHVISFHPLSVPRAQFLLRMQESEGFVVAVEGELSMEKVMPPKLEGLDDGVQFSVIVGVPDLRLTEFLSEEGYRMEFLR